jgi:hypothetical protein
MIRTFLFFLAFVTSAPVLVYSQLGGGQIKVTAIEKMTLYHNGVSGGLNVDRIYDCIPNQKIGFTAETYCKNTAHNYSMQYKLEWRWYRYKWSSGQPSQLVMVEYGKMGETAPVTVAANSDVTFITDEQDVGKFLPHAGGIVTVRLLLLSRPENNTGAWLEEGARSGHFHQEPAPTPPGGPGPG